MFLLFSAFTYYLYKRYSTFHDFEDTYLHLTKLKPYEYYMIGPIIFKSPIVKFEDKFQTREQYHEWIDNDIRSI